MSDTLSNFDSFSETIQQGIRELGWANPMPVQERVIPIMRRDADLIVQAVTGSGKTGAFGLPIVEKVDPELRKIQALIMAPTRELAIQIAAEVEIMGKHSGVETIAIYGGSAYGPQLDALERGVQVIAGTPGRILDHLKNDRMDLSKLKFLVFDEADELLSLGFWPDMKEIASFVPKKRQTGLFSATMPERVRSLSRFFLNEPEFISLTDGGVRTPEEIEHYHYIVQAQEKEHLLLRVLQYENPDSAIVFCNTRDDVRFITAYLQRKGIDADMIQGEMSQAAREKVMTRIKAGELKFLIATDIAARGIDISDLSHVISYTAPDSPETYLHRIGRTGRAGKTGTAISFVSGLDIANFRYLQQVNRMTIPERQIPAADAVLNREATRLANQIEHDLRELPERDLLLLREKYLPIVEKLIATEDGKRDLAAALYGYRLQGKPQPTPREDVSVDEPKTDGPPKPQRKRRRRRS